MVLDKQETGTGSCVQWHSCPLCGKVRLTSQPETNLDVVAPGSVDADGVDLDRVELDRVELDRVELDRVELDRLDQSDAYSHDSLDAQQRIDIASANYNYT